MINKNKNFLTLTILIFFAIILWSLPAYRPIGIDRDSISYEYSINQISETENYSSSIGKEPFYFLIVYISNLIFSDVVRATFAIYAFIAILLKLTSIYMYSKNVILSIFIYIGLFYILQEFNTIRTGVATGMFLLAYNDIKEKKLRVYILKILIATLFHYSAIILVAFYFVNFEWIRKNLLLFILISIFLSVTKLNLLFIKLFIIISPSFLSYKLEIYYNMIQNGLFENISLQRQFFNLSFTLYIFIFENKNLKKIVKADTELYLLNNLLKMSIFLFYFFSAIPVVSSRISETTSIYLVLLIPILIKKFKKNDIFLLSYFLITFCILLLSLYIKSYYPFYKYL